MTIYFDYGQTPTSPITSSTPFRQVHYIDLILDNVTELTKLNLNRRNELDLTFTKNGEAIDLTGFTVHFSVVSRVTEKFHITESEIDEPTKGRVVLEIEETDSEDCIPGVFYEYEITLVTADGKTWAGIKGLLQFTGYWGSTSTSGN